MKGSGGWVQRLRQKAEREIIDFRAGGSWEIYRNNNNEHEDTLVKGEEAATLNSWLNLRSPRLLSLPLEP